MEAEDELRTQRPPVPRLCQNTLITNLYESGVAYIFLVEIKLRYDELPGNALRESIPKQRQITVINHITRTIAANSSDNDCGGTASLKVDSARLVAISGASSISR
jgi:hypothetical protein